VWADNLPCLSAQISLGTPALPAACSCLHSYVLDQLGCFNDVASSKSRATKDMSIMPSIKCAAFVREAF
jgi:hypothetical protein